MNEHPHNHTSEEKIPSPWGRVAGILLALNGIGILIIGIIYGFFWNGQKEVMLVSMLLAFFFVTNNRGKEMLIATGMSAVYSIYPLIYDYYHYSDLYYSDYYIAFFEYLIHPYLFPAICFTMLFLLSLKMLLSNTKEKTTGILVKLWFIPAIFPILTFISAFTHYGGLDCFKEWRFDDCFSLYGVPLILSLAMLAAGKWLVKPEIIISTSTGGTGMEHRIKCQTCGQIFCYTDADINENDWNKAMRSMSGLATFLSALDGSKYDMYEQNKVGRSFDNKIKDYSHCPNCNSTNLIELTENDELQSTSINGQTLAIQNSVAHNFSNADEIKRFKELLDSGVITSEEFEAKKQVLLNK